MVPGIRVLNVLSEAGMMNGVTPLPLLSGEGFFGADRHKHHQMVRARRAVPRRESIAQRTTLLLGAWTGFLVPWHALQKHKSMLTWGNICEGKASARGLLQRGGGEELVVHQTHRKSVELLLKVRNRIIEMPVGKIGIADENAQHGSEEPEAEVVGDKALLHRKDRLTIPVVTIDAGLRRREVVDEARRLARQLEVLDDSHCLLAVIFEVCKVAMPLQRGATCGDELVDRLVL